METPMDNAPQLIRISELLMMSPYPVIIHPALREIVQLVGMLENSEQRVKLYKQGASQEDPCPAMLEYGPLWTEVHEKVVALVEEVSALAKETSEKIQKLDEEFTYTRLKTIAACPKEGCPDREGAQAELGWQDGEPVLQ